MSRHQKAWWLWAVGTVLIVLSWFHVVTNTVGWIGFGIGLAGSIMSWGARPPRSVPGSSEQPAASESDDRQSGH